MDDLVDKSFENDMADTTLNGWSMGSVPDIGDDQTYNFEWLVNGFCS
jgi:hypothetical protein